MGTGLPPSLRVDDSAIYIMQKDIYVLDSKNGSLQYQHHRSGTSHFSLLHGIMYVNTTDIHTSLVQAIDSHDGTLLWSYHAKGRLSQCPVIIDNVVYVSIVEGSIYALQANNGVLLWYSSIDPGPDIPTYLGPIVTTAPLVIDKIVYLAPGVNHPLEPFLYAFGSKDGRLLQKIPLPDTSAFSFTIHNGILYFSNAHSCSAVRLENGAVLWRWEPEETGQVCSAPIIHNNRVYLAGAELRMASSGEVTYWWQAFLCALHVSDGALLWQQSLEDAPSESRPTELCIINEILYVSTNQGLFSAYQPDDGSPLWYYQTKGHFQSSPVGMHEVVYIGDDSGSVYALRASDKELLWEAAIPLSLTTSADISVKNIQENF
ncbi:outer membrane protein assembly factor BamB family protein [Tengunoibacter tsumagoiensis]|uniref:Pyrrolo-quinoline quinone repeat domain-containing protein n=1 Tax=Tengunoibacter tsumagoiensis TaxID=2014871 RepID=A0A401ZY60_9CHLR|nr:PQQ-binding-like beta-propeller repeat protein [Tengunoibacter tsumagoiensis]GCE11763.1 hypothetical protein KTT_16220 [Tengunoibacter tsumagoiensis]